MQVDVICKICNNLSISVFVEVLRLNLSLAQACFLIFVNDCLICLKGYSARNYKKKSRLNCENKW